MNRYGKTDTVDLLPWKDGSDDCATLLPLVSVIMPAHNCEEFVAESVKSVLNQSYPKLELIVVDDASTDDTRNIVASMSRKDARIQLICNSVNAGPAETRNIGIRCARGGCIALLDSDDVWTLDKLEKQMKLYLAGSRIVYGAYDFIDENGTAIKRTFHVPRYTNYRKMLTNNVISSSTVLINAPILKQQLFSSKFYHEDYALWMELLKTEPTAEGIQEVIAHYRLRKGTRSADKLKAAAERWKIYRKLLNMNLIQSALAMAGYAIRGIMKYM